MGHRAHRGRGRRRGSGGEPRRGPRRQGLWACSLLPFFTRTKSPPVRWLGRHGVSSAVAIRSRSGPTDEGRRFMFTRARAADFGNRSCRPGASRREAPAARRRRRPWRRGGPGSGGAGLGLGWLVPRGRRRSGARALWATRARGAGRDARAVCGQERDERGGEGEWKGERN